MKIGIAVTTYKRPKHLQHWYDMVNAFTPEREVKVFLSSDTKERRGVAYRKNECLKVLQGCDYIFLFDDDCFPIKKGWMDFFIDAYKASGNHHFLYLKETSTIKKIHEHTAVDLQTQKGFTINEFNNCGGCFMFLTKEVIEKVGGFNHDYGIYGFEHAGYTNRIHQAGLTPMGMYLCPQGAGEYIYAMDYDNHLEWNVKLNHHPSMIDELDKLDGYIENNRKKYTEDIKTIYQEL